MSLIQKIRNSALCTIMYIAAVSSCQQSQQPIKFELAVSNDSSYAVEVPSYVTKYKCIGDYMSFTNDKYHMTITIGELIGQNFVEYTSQQWDRTKYTCTTVNQTDTTLSYKITSRNNSTSIWSAYNYYAMKDIQGKTYIISVYSDALGEQRMQEIITKMQQSLHSFNPKEDVCSQPQSSSDSEAALSAKYQNLYLSIKYPNSWSVTRNVDEITEAYIGTQDFGFSIVHFESDYTLSDIVQEHNANAKRAGMTIENVSTMTIDGAQSYRIVITFEHDKHTYKQVSYLLKRGDRVFNLRFGDIQTLAQENVIPEIVQSLKFL